VPHALTTTQVHSIMSAMTRPWLEALAHWVARHRRSVPVRRLAGLARRWLDWQANLDYELASNGEAELLRRLAHFKPRLIIDAGANVGDWSRAALDCCPTAQLHAFEIAAPTFATLQARLQGEARLQLHAVGLSDAPGEITLQHFAGAPALTTATAYPHPFAAQALAARVMRGDDFAAAQGIRHIDLLKIDVEGMEAQVLRGFDGLLRSQAVDLVQFEYGRVNILNRFLLADFHAFFAERGYRVGKLYPDGVDFRDYDLADEDFRGPNYLACRAQRTDLLQALGLPSA
jgi:FkbM family methyltransferase